MENSTQKNNIMIAEEVKLQPGQNLRYAGKGFPGYVKGQPYMVFEGYLDSHKIVVRYNSAKVLVDRRHTLLIK
jgi:hypothetical protein